MPIIMSSLQVDVAGVQLKNPTMLASGMVGETGGSLLSVASAGAGALVTKSIGMDPRSGYGNPTLVELEDGYVNAMGLPGPGIDDFRVEMEVAKRGMVPIIGSIFASSAKDFAFLSAKMEEYGASAVELNLSCPHAHGYGMEMGIDPEVVSAIVKECKDAVSIPVFAKLTPNTHRLVEVGRAVEKAGGDAVVAINTLKAIAISVEFKRPILSNRFGGLSGPAVKPVGLRCVFDLYAALDIPIIGVGGIETWRDALEYIMAGASAVQVGSAIGRRGMGVFSEITAGLERYVEQDRCGSIQGLVGVAHEHA
jgi:dihydroorotate dehydrogenase (NAD+) catalytic subunit